MAILLVSPTAPENVDFGGSCASNFKISFLDA